MQKHESVCMCKAPDRKLASRGALHVKFGMPKTIHVCDNLLLCKKETVVTPLGHVNM